MSARWCVVAGVLLGAGAAAAQEVPLRMGALDAYLLPEAYEIALARSAAPATVSGDATVLVLRPGGYVEAARGTNGFTCLVERSWSSPIGEHVDFFNPRLRAPICFNAEASRTVLQDYLLRTELALAGRSIAEIQAGVHAAIATGRLTAPGALAMSYMMSAEQLLGTDVGRFVPHVMFYVPYATNAQVGHVAGRACHVCLFEHAGGPLAAMVVPVPEFLEAPQR